ncbi:hypothetical protein JCM9492_11100 [Aquifex pyrophilus]
MTEFITLSDISENVAISQDDVSFANTYVSELVKGYTFETIPEYLKELAKIVALERAYLRLSQGEEGIYLEKAKAYRELRQEMERKLNLQTLGGVLSVSLGRA